MIPVELPRWVWWVAAAAAGNLLVLAERAGLEFSVLGGVAVWRVVVPLLRFSRRGEPAGLRALVERAVGLGYQATRREAERQEEPERLTLREAWRGIGETLGPARPLAGSALRLLSKTYWQKLDWQTTLSLPDAAQTAVAAGALWSVKAQLAALAHLKLRLAPVR